ncbi:MAG: amidohydrolase family protein [Pirellulaceae bacterium]|nr:amidohydrolase family protein [Pirellulaceae bacterium]
MKLWCSEKVSLFQAIVLVFFLGALRPLGAETPEVADQKTGSSDAPTAWNVEAPPGPQRAQEIDVTEGTWLSVDVSPDGTQIVFDLLGDLYLMPIAGADGKQDVFPVKLTSGIAWDMQPRFSPDGKRIAFTSDRNGKSKLAGDNIWTVNLHNNIVRQVTNETFRLVNGPAWAPDGDYIVARKHFSSRRSLGAGEMWLYHRLGHEHDAMAGVQLTKRPNDQKDVNEPVFSPDGKYLYYSQDATAGDTFEYDKDSNKQIYVVNRLDLETGESEVYLSGPGGACRPVPSPDGRQIAFVRRVGAKTGLHLFDTESGGVRLIYDKLERDMQEAWAIHGVYPNFAWLPDGQSLVIWARGKIRRIYLADGSDEVVPFRIKDERKVTQSLRFPSVVAPEEFDVKMLRWVQTSPQGDRVAFQALGAIYLRDLPAGKPRRLTAQNDHFEFCPSFSSDGRALVYTTWNDEQLGSIRVASLDPDQPGNAQVSEQPGHYLNPVFSPDGQTLVYERTAGGYLTSPLWSLEPGIYAMPRVGGKSRRLAKLGSNPQFADQSDRVYFQKSQSEKTADNLQLCSIDLQGFEERSHYTSKWATDYRLSPDGQWVAFVERFNVYVAPFVKVGATVEVGPQAKNLPTRRVSEQAGDWIHFSHDSQRLHWSLGPTLFSCNIEQAFEFPDQKKGVDKRLPLEELEIGFRATHANPSGKIAFVGGRLVTMRGNEVIEEGTLVIDANRIVALGKTGDVEVPADAQVIELDGQTVLPGFVDTHAHGPQSNRGMTPQRNWVDYARLAFGVTTIHDPSNDTDSIFAASELAKAGRIVAPRTFSTGRILYGAAGSYKAEIDSLEDARFHLKRMQAIGAFSVKSYNQPRRDQRQQVIAAARELGMLVVPEGGSTFMHNMTMIVDGHTGIEHTLPVQNAYDDVMDLWRGTQVGYTPTLSVAYGGISGEQYWYEVDDLWLHPRLREFLPPHVLNPRSRRRHKSPQEDYNHIRVAGIARQLVEDGGLVQAGGHGQLNGICTHWEMWSFVQGGMTPLQALRCGTLLGAKYLGLDADIGSLEVGKLADIAVLEVGYDPTKDIRDSERIHYVVVNGRVFDARRMNEIGSPAPRAPFYWERSGHGIGVGLTEISGCGCQRLGGATSWWNQGNRGGP